MQTLTKSAALILQGASASKGLSLNQRLELLKK